NDVLFERFYRADSSRNSETGGTGIGLSVAKSIVDKAKGKITAYSEDGKSLRITVYLPL
ncbi:MAG: ATP-binding protein, partial [Eubacterium sp.]|nr:ATP-binding protein [Eubacterium sp.]